MNYKNTQKLQLLSLIFFMKALGYTTADRTRNLGRGFKKITKDTETTNNYISSRDAIALHNISIWGMTSVGLRLGVKEAILEGIVLDNYEQALNQRLVQQVKLQVNKNGFRGLDCFCNRVKITQKGYDYLLDNLNS